MSDAGAGTYNANTMGLDTGDFTDQIGSSTNSYISAQRKMFIAEMKAQNRMQADNTEGEFCEKMNDAAWKTASSGASDKIQ